MRIALILVAAPVAMTLASCANRGIAGRDRPDEFAVARTAPLVIPPDFALTPPRPGQPATGANEARVQALQALFGGPSPRSEVERDLLQQAEADGAALGARSLAGDPQTVVVERGAIAQTIIRLPQGDGQEASVSVPQ